jgi:hypothetical protein
MLRDLYVSDDLAGNILSTLLGIHYCNLCCKFFDDGLALFSNFSYLARGFGSLHLDSIELVVLNEVGEAVLDEDDSLNQQFDIQLLHNFFLALRYVF